MACLSAGMRAREFIDKLLLRKASREAKGLKKPLACTAPSLAWHFHFEFVTVSVTVTRTLNRMRLNLLRSRSFWTSLFLGLCGLTGTATQARPVVGCAPTTPSQVRASSGRYDGHNRKRERAHFRLPFFRHPLRRYARAARYASPKPAMDARFKAVVSGCEVPDFTKHPMR